MEVIHSGQSLQFSLLQLCSPRTKLHSALCAVCTIHMLCVILRDCFDYVSHHKWRCDDSTGLGEVFVVSTACCYYRRQPAPLSPRKGTYFGVRSENWAKHGECCCSRISEIYLPSTASWPEKRGTVIIIAHTDDIYWRSHCPCFLLYGSSPTPTVYRHRQHQRMNFIQKFIEKSIIHREHNHIIDYDYFPSRFENCILRWNANGRERETFRKCFPFYSFDCSITVTSLFHQVKLNPERTLKPSQ